MTLVKKIFGIIALAGFLVSTAIAFAQSDIEAHPNCAKCGMFRKAFGYSRMLVQFEDGGEIGVCSVHCAVLALKANQGRKVKALLVADRGTRELLEAEKAIWTMGGKKPGVMTNLPKWAFGSREAAEEFVRVNGGEIVAWEDVWRIVTEEVGRLR